jgi:hypothetical protein
MCGIFGWQLKPGAIDNSGLKRLSISLSRANDKRGGDSWGYFGYNNNNNHYKILKGMGRIYPQVRRFIPWTTFMAHCRKASPKSPITEENAHPFIIGNIIGAHNGFISNHEELNKKYDRKYTVDSKHLFKHLENKLSFDDICGYGSMQWADKGDSLNQINLMKFRRDLYIVALGNDDNGSPLGIIWSSVLQPIIGYLRQRGMPYSVCNIEEGTVYRVAKCRLYMTPRTLKFGYQSPAPTIVNEHTCHNNNNIKPHNKKGSKRCSMSPENSALINIMQAKIDATKNSNDKIHLRIVSDWARRGILCKGIEDMQATCDYLSVKFKNYQAEQKIAESKGYITYMERKIRKLDIRINANVKKYKIIKIPKTNKKGKVSA